MYCEFFGLTAAPFNNTPDPRFFYNTPDHEEALASLLYAVEERKGCVLVTGEVGAGKTLLSRMLLNRLGSNVRTATVTNTRLNGFELLRAICREFDLEVDQCTTSAELTHALEKFLLEQYARQRRAVVILDEAQNLPAESLEELRMLGNLEADDAKLLQVLILGQPELQQKIRHPSMRQTFQRIFRTFHLRALDDELTEGYVHHRLKIAGAAPDRAVFDDRAIAAVQRHSGGIPRVINQLCDNAMLAAYGESKSTVTAEYVEEIAHHMLWLPPASGEDEPNREEPRGGGRADDRIADMAERLSAFEDKLHGITKHLAKAKSAAQSAEEQAAASAVAAEQQRMVLEDKTRALLEEAERNIQSLLSGARRTAQSMESRAATSVAEIQQQNAALRDKTRALMEEVRAMADDRRMRVGEVVRDGRSEIEAVRRVRTETEAMLKRTGEAHEQLAERLGRAIQEAEEASQRMETQAAAFLEDSRKEKTAVSAGLESLLKEMRAKGEASMQRAAELLSQQRAELETSRRQFDEFSSEIRERSERMERQRESSLSEFKCEAQKIVEQIHSVGDRTQTRAESITASLEEMARDARERFTKAQAQFDGVVQSAETEIRTACTSLAATRDQMLAEARESRDSSKELLGQTQVLLDETHDRCETVLANLHEQVTEQTRQAERIWRRSAEEGAKTLSELSATLADARKRTGDARTELDALVAGASRQVEDAKSMIDANIKSHRDEVQRLTRQADALKSLFRERFELVQSDLNAMLEQHRSAVRGEAASLAADIDEKTRKAHTDAAERVARLQDQLKIAGETSGRLCDELKATIEASRGRAAVCQGQFEREIESVQRRLVELFERNRAALRTTESQVESLTDRARQTGEQMQSDMDKLEQSARVNLAERAKDFEMLLRVTSTRAEKLRAESEATSASIAERLERAAGEAMMALCKPEEAAAMVREQSARSLAEVRDCLAQMNDRADVLKRDLVRIGDEVRAASAATVERVEKCGALSVGQIDELRRAARTDAEANHARLSELKQQVEQGAEQMRVSAAELLDQVQSGAAALREHAETLLAEAQSGSEKVNASASKMLLQAQTAAELFREQAQGLLNKTESVSAEIRREIQTLRSDVTDEAGQIREQIGAAQRDLTETRRETAENATKATDARKFAQADTERLLSRAEAVHAEAEALLAMPKQLVDEAKTQAQALSEMSRKISTVVKQLSTAGETARENRAALEHAGADAERKIELLKRHTERVGQLVGIIRQLYGTMDARIARLRGRLLEADDLFRSVPQEIESLRSVLEAETRLSKPEEEPLQTPPPSKARPQSPAPLALRGKPPAIRRGKAQASVLAPQRLKSAKGSLGEIVQRNQKLNEWLQNVLGDEAVSTKPAPAPDRIAAASKTPATQK